MKLAAVGTLILGLVLGLVQADKDDSYYIAGTGNPNRNEKMYWKDAENIFQDLSKFQSLHVEFHNCAWSWMQISDEGNDIDENDYWYMGKIPPMGANVAFSLYGSLKGETFSGCGEDTFINSFYTNSGFTNFARAMNYAGLSGFSSYSYDDDSYGKYTAQCYGGYGVGCDYTNGFAVHTYSGDECNPEDYTGVKDTLSNLNSAMKTATCTQIYNANSYRGSPYGTALELLSYSHSCFYQDFFSPDGDCPDPYGKLKYYQKQFYNGIQESKKQDPYQVSQRKTLYKAEIKKGKIKTAIGFFLCALAFIVMMFECLVACTDRREREMRRYVPRQQDFIVTKRSKDMDEDIETPTVADRSDTDSENYVTMSDTYTPPTSMTPSAEAAAPAQSPAPPAPAVQSPSPEPLAPPVQIPQQPPVSQESRAPIPEMSPSPIVEPEIKVNAAPAVIAPISVPSPVLPSPGAKVQLKAEVQKKETITVFSPPSLASKAEPKTKESVADAKAEEVEPITTSPVSAAEENIEAVGKKDKEKLEEVKKEEKEAAAPDAAVPVPVASTESLPNPPSPEVESEEPALSETPSMRSISNIENPQALFADIPEDPSRGNLSQGDEKDDAASVPSLDEIIASREFDSDSDEEVEPEAATEAATETVTEVATEDMKPESSSNFSQEAATSQYFDANELEADIPKDDIELRREASEDQENSAEEDKEADQIETSPEESKHDKETAQVETLPEETAVEPSETKEQASEEKEVAEIKTSSSAPVESQNNEEEEQEVQKSSSRFNFAI